MLCQAKSIFSCLGEQCTKKIDVGFVLDYSASVKNEFEKVKYFVKYLASKLEISKDGIHVGLITYSSNAYLNSKLSDSFSIDDFHRAVDAAPFLGLTTRTDRALALAKDELFSAENGARLRAHRIIILLTDSTTDEGSENPGLIADQLRQIGIYALVIAIGDKINDNEVEQIAGKVSNIYKIDSFGSLIDMDLINKVVKDTCAKGLCAFLAFMEFILINAEFFPCR